MYLTIHFITVGSAHSNTFSLQGVVSFHSVGLEYWAQAKCPYLVSNLINPKFKKMKKIRRKIKDKSYKAKHFPKKISFNIDRKAVPYLIYISFFKKNVCSL